MDSVMEKIEVLETLIRDLRKVESKMRVGQIIDAWREQTRIIAYVDKARQNFIKEAATQKQAAEKKDEV